MNNQESKWTRQELITYAMLFIINVDQSKGIYELNRLQINPQRFTRICREFNSNSDYQRIQRLCELIKYENFSKTQLSLFFQEIKSIINWGEVKNKFLVKNVFSNLERLSRTVA